MDTTIEKNELLCALVAKHAKWLDSSACAAFDIVLMSLLSHRVTANIMSATVQVPYHGRASTQVTSCKC
jgi:hypothetical protein